MQPTFCRGHTKISTCFWLICKSNLAWHLVFIFEAWWHFSCLFLFLSGWVPEWLWGLSPVLINGRKWVMLLTVASLVRAGVGGNERLGDRRVLLAFRTDTALRQIISHTNNIPAVKTEPGVLTMPNQVSHPQHHCLGEDIYAGGFGGHVSSTAVLLPSMPLLPWTLCDWDFLLL